MHKPDYVRTPACRQSCTFPSSTDPDYPGRRTAACARRRADMIVAAIPIARNEIGQPMEFHETLYLPGLRTGLRLRRSRGHRLNEITLAIKKLGSRSSGHAASRMPRSSSDRRRDRLPGGRLGKKGLEGKTAALINLMRRRGLEMPIVMLVRRKRLEDIPVEVLDYIDGYIFLSEETPEFIARNLVDRLKQYAETWSPFSAARRLCRGRQPTLDLPGPQRRHLLPQPHRPNFRRAPGRGGVPRRPRQLSARTRRPAGSRRSCAQGTSRKPPRSSAPRRPYFVLNGTSSSNKIVLSALVAEGDLVLFDRNHKAAHHGALFIGGAHSDLSQTDRNAHGLIGPIFHEALDEALIREKIRNTLRWSPTRRLGGGGGHSGSPSSNSAPTTAPFTTPADRREDRTSLRLYSVRRGLGRVHEIPPDLCRPIWHGAERHLGPNRPGIMASRSRPTSSSQASARPPRST
jgi:hypothetical protein